MWEQIDAFRRQLDLGGISLGSAVTLSDPAVTEALCDSVDFLWIDLEHNPTSLESLAAHLMAAKAGKTPALVRVPSSDVAWIKRVLDTGTEAIIVPQIRSAQEVAQVVSACRYPPLGQRGFGPRRATNYGRQPAAEGIAQANQRLFVAVQIETKEALDQLDAILAVPGYDSIVIGPYDLSGSLGMLGQVQNPQIVAAVASIAQRARQAGKYVGMGMGPDLEHARQAAGQGVQWIQCGCDFGHMIGAIDTLFTRIRQGGSNPT
ncbi:MAG: HpcH/HpaI aldolase family protein [Planctomycetales bacterium]